MACALRATVAAGQPHKFQTSKHAMHGVSICEVTIAADGSIPAGQSTPSRDFLSEGPESLGQPAGAGQNNVDIGHGGAVTGRERHGIVPIVQLGQRGMGMATVFQL
jgi:hypothetical protein